MAPRLWKQGTTGSGSQLLVLFIFSVDSLFFISLVSFRIFIISLLAVVLGLICSFSGFLSCRLKIDFEFSYLIYAVTVVNFPLDTGFTASTNFFSSKYFLFFS